MQAFELNPRQVEVRELLASAARHCLIYGGSRSTKTFLLCYCIATRALMAPSSRHLIARLHNIDVRQSVMMDTWPKMMGLAYPGVLYELNKQDQFATFDGDAEVWFGGLDEKERADKILGKEFATIYVNEASQVSYASVVTLRTRLAQVVNKRDGRALVQKGYYDLNPVGRGHWTYKEFIEGVRPENGLPLKTGTRVHAIMNPSDNPLLSQEYLDELDAMPERQRQRYKLGQYQSEVPGALWPSDLIDSLRVAERPELQRIVVGVDPSGSDGTGGDSQGVIVAGLGVDGHGYILSDDSCRLGPEGWARRVVNAYHREQADCIVAEVNYGGAMVESTIRTADRNVPVTVVTASRGKHVRAEPVSALYGLGKVHHVGHFPELEEQMGMMTTAGYQGSGSPDRLDAMVWCLTELMLQSAEHAGFLAMIQADNVDRAKARADKPAAELQHQPGSVEWARANADL